MKTTVTPVDQAELDALNVSADGASDESGEQQERTFGPRVKLTVEVDQETFENAIEEAFRKKSPKKYEYQDSEKEKPHDRSLNHTSVANTPELKRSKTQFPATTQTQYAPKQSMS